MASASLSAEMRSDRGKGVARKLRAAGRIPGVVYGHGREPQSLSLVARDLDKLLSHIAAGSTVIELTLGKATCTYQSPLQCSGGHLQLIGHRFLGLRAH